MSMNAIFKRLQIPRGDGWQDFVFARAGQRAKAALFALKNFVTTGNITSYVNICGMYFRMAHMEDNNAILEEVIFNLNDNGHGQEVDRCDSKFQFRWDSVEMKLMRVHHHREPRTLAELVRESDDTEYEPYGQI